VGSSSGSGFEDKILLNTQGYVTGGSDVSTQVSSELQATLAKKSFEFKIFIAHAAARAALRARPSALRFTA